MTNSPTTVYQVTVDHRNGTSERCTMAQDAAYALVLGELRTPTPGICRVDIRPVAGQPAAGAIMDISARCGAR